MTTLPPLNFDTHREKASSIWQCSCIKSNCCATVNEKDEQGASLEVEVITATQGADEKAQDAARKCCIIL